ncbi:MAG: MBL fold metallo-hydrolase [Anaerolineales bacterium]|nr:MBL fold metallo-hydrolase [Anaerolineales bacterium]
MSAAPALLTPTLLVAQSEFFLTNSGAFVSDGAALLIDPCLRPEEIDALPAAVAALGAAPQAVLLTHSHWDHILGPERLPGVPVIAQARYPVCAAQSSAALLRELGEWEARTGRQRAAPFAAPVPDQLVFYDHPLRLGALDLRLLHVPGHAADQLAVYDPAGGALWASDILSDVEIPFVADNLSAYERTLANLATLDLRVLVPGHGHPTTDSANIQTRLSEDRAYLSELSERVARAVRQGLSAEATVELCASIPYRRPEQNAGPHRLNVESAYLELGGEGDRRALGWSQYE